jgi:pimeloyl-ACP methyl ester carboxylesterase
VRPPYVLVGHSFGGLVMRIFAARHRAEVAGLVLIEPAIAEEWAAPGEQQHALIARGTRLCHYGAVAARRGLARAVAVLVGLGALGPARAMVKVISRGGLRRQDEGILAPIWKLPPEARAVLRQAWTQPKFFEALGSQITTICDSAREVLEAGLDYGDLPLVVISSALAEPTRLDADARVARMSTRGRHVLAEESGHWVPLDAPQAVVDAIVTLVGEIRTRGRAG